MKSKSLFIRSYLRIVERATSAWLSAVKQSKFNRPAVKDYGLSPITVEDNLACSTGGLAGSSAIHERAREA